MVVVFIVVAVVCVKGVTVEPIVTAEGVWSFLPFGRLSRFGLFLFGCLSRFGRFV